MEREDAGPNSDAARWPAGWRYAGLLIGLVARPGLNDLWRRHPHWIGVAVGLCWWLWLAPSALGWVIVAVSLLSAARSTWPLRPAPRTGAEARLRLPGGAVR